MKPRLTIMDFPSLIEPLESRIAPAALSIANVSISEGDSGIKNATFTVTLDAAATGNETVHYATSNGTALDGSQYDAVSGDLHFIAGATTATFDVPIHGNTIAAADKSFTVTLSAAANADLGTATATGTIQNDDASISVADISLTDGSTGTKNATFEFKLPYASANQVTVHYKTIDGTAIAGDGKDYVFKEGDVTFEPGKTSKTMDVVINGTNVAQADKSFTLELTGATNATLTNSTAKATILNDDTHISLADVSLLEGNVGDSTSNFVVTLDAARSFPVTVHWTTLDGTAKAGTDYTTSSGDITFAPDDVSLIIHVPVTGNYAAEANKTFTVQLSSSTDPLNPTNASFTKTSATGTILNDDTKAGTSIGVADVSVVEGNGGTGVTANKTNFVVTLGATQDFPVSFSYSTADGTALAGATATTGDYTKASGIGTIPAGSTSLTVSVPVIGNLLGEVNKTFSLGISQPGNAILGNTTATGTILNDDFVLKTTDGLGLSADHTQFGYVDVDGDLVIVKSSKALFTSQTVINSAFHFRASADNAQQFQLEGIDFTKLSSLQIKSDLTFTVTKVGDTDGSVNVGSINALTDLGSIVIPGDLGKIVVGDTFATQGLKLLDVQSIGLHGTSTGATDLISKFNGPVGTIHVGGDISGATLNFLNVGKIFGTGSIKTLLVDGALQGGTTEDSGAVKVQGNISSATIGRIYGGAGLNSGSVQGAYGTLGSIGSLKVLHSITGGSGNNSGSVSATNIVTVSVGEAIPENTVGGIIGGSGNASGVLQAGVALGKVSIIGSVIGGAGLNSGQIYGPTISYVHVHGSLIGGTAGLAAIAADATADPVVVARAAQAGFSGVIRAGELGTVIIDGSLIGGSGVDADHTGVLSGAVVSQGSIKSIMVGAITGGAGVQSGTVQALNGAIPNIQIAGDLTGSTGSNSGSIAARSFGNIKIGGNVTGGDGFHSGLVFSNSTINSISVVKSFIGGGGELSGAVVTNQGRIAQTTVGGNVLGGAGASSGFINSDSLGKVTVGGLVLGGSGAMSGSIHSDQTAITSLSIGALTGGAGAGSGTLASKGLINAKITGYSTITGAIAGDVTGGSGKNSGSISVMGGDIKGLSLASLIGGPADGSGTIITDGILSGAKISKDVIGGDAPESGDASGGASALASDIKTLQGTGYIQARQIASLAVGGAIKAGVNNGVDNEISLIDSGVVRATRDILSLTAGKLTGSDTNNVIISAAGFVNQGFGAKTNVAIKTLSVAGDVSKTEILAGYGLVDASSPNARGAALNGDAQIGKVTVGGDWEASSLVAGVIAGSDTCFGTADNKPIGMGNPDIFSRISSLIVNGAGLGGDTQNYGVVAGQIGMAKFHGIAVALISSAALVDTNFHVLEV